MDKELLRRNFANVGIVGVAILIAVVLIGVGFGAIWLLFQGVAYCPVTTGVVVVFGIFVGWPLAATFMGKEVDGPLNADD